MIKGYYHLPLTYITNNFSLYFPSTANCQLFLLPTKKLPSLFSPFLQRLKSFASFISALVSDLLSSSLLEHLALKVSILKAQPYLSLFFLEAQRLSILEGAAVSPSDEGATLLYILSGISIPNIPMASFNTTATVLDSCNLKHFAASLSAFRMRTS